MKKLFLVLSLATILITTGCFKKDTMEDITIYTSVYPIEYITTRLYGKNSKIKSIYPNGIMVDKYSLTDKQIVDYSKTDLFIFTGLNKEKDYIEPMFKNNRGLKIIDASASIEYNNRIEEIWLDPSNYLMIAQNIKTGLNEYITNQYLVSSITDNYEELKLELSKLDAKIQVMMETANNTTIVVSNDLFKYLEKYGFTVISLEENSNLNDKTKASVKSMINSGKVKYIYTIQNEGANDTIKSLIDGKDVKLLEFHTLSNLTEEERASKKDYMSIMNENIELLKQQIYE